MLKEIVAVVCILVLDDAEATRLNVPFEISVAPADRKRAVARAKAGEMVRNTPDVDVAKVHQLKAQLKNGTYRIDSDSIANSMLNEAMADYRAANERPPKSASCRAGQSSANTI